MSLSSRRLTYVRVDDGRGELVLLTHVVLDGWKHWNSGVGEADGREGEDYGVEGHVWMRGRFL